MVRFFLLPPLTQWILGWSTIEPTQKTELYVSVEFFSFYFLLNLFIFFFFCLQVHGHENPIERWVVLTSRLINVNAEYTYKIYTNVPIQIKTNKSHHAMDEAPTASKHEGIIFFRNNFFFASAFCRSVSLCTRTGLKRMREKNCIYNPMVYLLYEKKKTLDEHQSLKFETYVSLYEKPNVNRKASFTMESISLKCNPLCECFFFPSCSFKPIHLINSQFFFFLFTPASHRVNICFTG